MNYMKNNESTIMGHFRKAGLKFSEPDLAPFRSAVKDVWGKYADRVGGWDRINRVQELQKQCK
jgi:hypothetical protein